ncbi:MAG: hypothetical protein WA463_14525 [Terriglobales bacterium]
MRRISALWGLLLVLAVIAPGMAQVVSPLEIKDPELRALQQRYTGTLQAVATQIETLKFPYPFYFSRVLDVNEAKQRQLDQRSIRFAKFENQTVLQITGNYYASYATPSMDGNARARKTFLDVMLPLLKAAVPQFPADQDFQGFALEVSHHIRGTVSGIKAENSENVVVVLPRAAAKKLVSATDVEAQQAALLDGRAYLNGEPMTLWLSDDPVPADWNKHAKGKREPAPEAIPQPAPAAEASVSQALINPPAMPVRLITPSTLKALDASHQEVVGRVLRDLASQANFVSYAAPAFIGFHEGAYLQLSMTTTLDQKQPVSRYAGAALAFDEHISHLVRPVLAYFQQDSSFDGVDFSTTVKGSAVEKSLSVEFFLPFSAMRCYAQYDCSGQLLLNSGIVLINGERAGLDLQLSETKR